MPQSPDRLRNDRKCVEWDVKPYCTAIQLDRRYDCIIIVHETVKSCHSAGASLYELPPELQQLALNFLATFFTRHPTEQ